MTIDEQIKAVEREIGMRERVYPGWVAAKRMSQAKAEHEIAAMRAVLKTLQELRDGHRSPALDWTPVGDRLPDDDTTVMIALTDDDEPVWMGWHDGEGWHVAEGAPADVTHWKPIPEGPRS